MNYSFKIFQSAWRAITVLAWLSVAYLLSHKSEFPRILGRYSWRYFAFLGGALGLAVIISIANRRNRFARIYAIRFNVLLLFSSVVLTLLCLEVFVRVADPLGISYYELSQYQLDKTADSDLIFRHRASWSRTYNGIEVRYNEFGQRDEPIQAKVAAEYRILVLGDSVTFGWGVPQDEIFTSRLQQILLTRQKRPIRVINTGVGGYNSVQQSIYLRKEGLSFQPNTVLLVYVSNDIEVNRGPLKPMETGSLKGKSLPQIFETILGRSWTYRLIVHVCRYGNFRGRDQDAYESIKGGEGWKASMESLREMAESCRSQGIPLVVFYFRMQDSPFDLALLQDVRRWAAPFPLMDMGPWFSNLPVRKYVNSKVDSHPNSEGHKVMAENIAEHLLREGYLRSR
jgi:lysophospholipase L1-like esterase